MVSARCTTPAAARAAISRTAAGTRPPGRTTPPSRCSCGFRSRRPMRPSARCWTAHRANVVAEPTYGGQLQDLAIPGHRPEGRMVIDYARAPGRARRTARWSGCARPRYRIADLGYGPLHPAGDAEPARRAADDRARPARGGRGGGHPGSCRSRRCRWRRHLRPAEPGVERRATGRSCSAASAGRPASRPSIEQGGHAMAGDVGVGNPIAPPAWGDCTAAEAACRAAPNGNSAQYDDLEAPQAVMDQILFYSAQPRRAGPPRRRRPDRAARQAAVLRRRAAPAATCPSSRPGATGRSRRSPAS